MTSQDDLIDRGSEIDVSCVGDVVASGAKLIGQEWREVLVDEESHAGWRRGSWRSRRASAA